MKASLADRFWSKVDITEADACWHWTASTTKQGYGRIGRTDKPCGYDLAHRVAYELTCGDIPDDLEIDHLCRVRDCVNPTHLEVVTHKVNTQRAYADQTTCKRGHSLIDPANIYAARGRRECRRCRTEAVVRVRVF